MKYHRKHFTFFLFKSVFEFNHLSIKSEKKHVLFFLLSIRTLRIRNRQFSYICEGYHGKYSYLEVRGYSVQVRRVRTLNIALVYEQSGNHPQQQQKYKIDINK